MNLNLSSYCENGIFRRGVIAIHFMIIVWLVPIENDENG